MSRAFHCVAFALAALVLCLPALAQETAPFPRYHWENGPPDDPAFFPIAVWLQHPKNAERFKAAGINTYVGLWRGPTQEQLDALAAAGMRVICAQNETGLRNKDNPVIIGWMHGDEPDNAQSLGEGKGYGPPVPPEEVAADYREMKAADPTRPVLLNLGQGVAYDNWIGRGVRRNHPEDYPEYLEGCDIASFDIYPAVHSKPEVAGKLEFVARGVERLVRWTEGQKPVWNCLECTRISNVEVKPTPAQVRAEAWMALIRGSRGLIYFVHQFRPVFRETALLDDPEMLAAVTALNRQIRELAPILNSPTLLDFATITADPEKVPIASMAKRGPDGDHYLFTAALRGTPVEGRFQLKDGPWTEAEVIGENRSIPIRGGSFSDGFEPYAVHLYRLRSSE